MAVVTDSHRVPSSPDILSRSMPDNKCARHLMICVYSFVIMIISQKSPESSHFSPQDP